MDFYKYQYAVRNVVLSLDQNYFLNDGCVTYLFIQHDYTNRRLPIIRMNIEMEIAMIKKLYANQEKARMKLELYEYQMNDDEKIIGTSLYWQHTFTVIPARDQTTYIASDDITTEKAIDMMNNLQLVELYLIDMDAVKWFTTKTCTILEKCSKGAALHAVMQMRNIPNGIVIATPPVNNQIINRLILPMGDLIGNIDTINKGYGLYSSYPIIYYDLMNLYCIDKVNPNITLPLAKEYGNIIFTMQNMTVPDHQITGSFNDAASRTHFINLTFLPEINDYTHEVGSTKFSTVATINKDGVVNKTTLDENATALSYAYEYSDQTTDQVINETMYGPIVSIRMQNTAVSFLKPHKIVSFQMDTQYQNLKLDGNIFRIQDWSLSITREGAVSQTKYIHDAYVTLQQVKKSK